MRGVPVGWEVATDAMTGANAGGYSEAAATRCVAKAGLVATVMRREKRTTTTTEMTAAVLAASYVQEEGMTLPAGHGPDPPTLRRAGVEYEVDCGGPSPRGRLTRVRTPSPRREARRL
jgi:hypothetical protein